MSDNKQMLKKKYIKKITRKIEKLIQQVSLLEEVEMNSLNNQTGGVRLKQVLDAASNNRRCNEVINRLNRAHNMLTEIHALLPTEDIFQRDYVINEIIPEPLDQDMINQLDPRPIPAPGAPILANRERF